MKHKLLVIILLCFTQNLWAQKNNDFLFKSGDRVCFIGNSITNNGEFFNNIYLYSVTRFPQDDIWYFNCGISGDNAAGVIKRLDKDILVHRPTWSVVMLGMNDVLRNLYQASRGAEPEIAKKRQAAIDIYRRDLESIVKKLVASKSKVILEKPTLYDQTAKLPAENLYGVNDALKRCADLIQSLADRYGLMAVDYYSIMNQLNHQLQQQDSTATLTGPDRVHPGPVGHFVMTYEFLKTVQAPQVVAELHISKNSRQSQKASINCRITELKFEPNGVTFACIENSLPFPQIKEAADALRLVTFTDEFNQEIVKVKDLKKGSYDLLIDGQYTESYDSDTLARGINLATNMKTPQYQQSLKLLDACRKYRQVESGIRGLKFVEHYALSEMKEEDLADMDKVKRELTVKQEKFKDSPYFMGQFKAYVLNKPKQGNMEQTLKELHQTILQTNKPVKHIYQLVKKS